jgi:hypothetical protein
MENPSTDTQLGNGFIRRHSSYWIDIDYMYQQITHHRGERQSDLLDDDFGLATNSVYKLENRLRNKNCDKT